jgi:hypothetical protein
MPADPPYLTHPENCVCHRPADDPRDALAQAAVAAGVSITKGIQRDRHPDPWGLLVDALASLGYIIAPVGDALEEVIVSSIALGKVQAESAQAAEQDRLAAIGAAVERLPKDHDVSIHWLAPDPADDYVGGWLVTIDRGKYENGVNKPRITGEGPTLPEAIAAALDEPVTGEPER